MLFKQFCALLLVALLPIFGAVQAASAQQLVFHGFAVDNQAAIGTSWRTTRSTPLWPYAQDSGFPRIRNLPRGAVLRAVSAFTRSATGDYIQVRYRGSVGWVDQRDIRRASGGGGGGGGGNAPIVNTASGVAYFITNVNNFASLRSRRSTQSTRLAQVPRGATVFTTGRQSVIGNFTWLSVSFNGQRGWMPRRYLRRLGGGGGGGGNPTIAFPVGTYQIVNVNNWASLRARTNRSSNRIITVPRGQSVYFGGQRRRANGETWLRVDYDGFVGWMPTQYLRKN